MKFQKRWWLGFLGFIGVYKFPDVVAAFHGQASAWEYLYLTWLIWLLYFVPERSRPLPPSVRPDRAATPPTEN